MQYKVSELSGALLDAAVAKAEGLPFLIESFMMVPPKPIACWLKVQGRLPVYEDGPYAPSTEWEAGGPIIQRDGISVMYDDLAKDGFCAWIGVPKDIDGVDAEGVRGEAPLIAAMRCLVSSKYGDVVDLP
jgi:hypothetical protein